MGGGGERSSPPLNIVIGAFAAANSQSAKSSNQDSAASSSLNSTTLCFDSPATYILGTSYYATPSLGDRRSVLKLNKDGRVPCEDRKSPFSQFKPKSLLLSTIRVTAINISTTMSNFFSDQLHSEQQIEKRVDAGEITAREADELNEEWENKEWKLRMDSSVLIEKIGRALLRFHACTAMSRFYEFIMGRYVLKVDGIVSSGSTSNGGNNNSNSTHLSQEQAITIMDKLTRDTFQASKRTSQLLHNQEHSPGKVISADGIETTTSRELARQMFSTCIWANIIPFLAELTVQQGVLIYGYGVHYVARQMRKKNRERNNQECNKINDDDDDDDDRKDDDNDVSESAYALSLMFRSSRLSIARYMSWISASAGGAIGSVIWPGWGTIFGIQVGDAVVGALID